MENVKLFRSSHLEARHSQISALENSVSSRMIYQNQRHKSSGQVSLYTNWPLNHTKNFKHKHILWFAFHLQFTMG